MGLSLGTLAVGQGHEVVVWDPDESARQSAARTGTSAVDELADVIHRADDDEARR